MVEQEEARGSGERGMGGGGEELKKGPWTPAEDAILVEHVRRHGEGNWNAVRRHSGLARCGKSCRLRWANHLRPNLKKGSFAPDEELLILRLHAQLGNKWARIAAQVFLLLLLLLCFAGFSYRAKFDPFRSFDPDSCPGGRTTRSRTTGTPASSGGNVPVCPSTRRICKRPSGSTATISSSIRLPYRLAH